MKRRRVIIPTFEEIKWMPPTITLINTLVELGYDVVYITIYPDEYYNNFDKNHVSNVYIFSKNIEILKYVKNRLLASVAFRVDVLVKKMISHFVGLKINRILEKEDILWVVNELTVMYAGARFLKKYKDKYIFTMYELHPHGFKSRNIEKAANYACVNVVPEYNRSHMQKLFFKLSDCPMVLPNKPENHPGKKNINIGLEDVEKKINSIKKSGKRIVLYMGIIGEERPLEPFVEAIDKMHEKYEFVIMGRKSEYLNKLQNKYPDKFTYLGFYNPPLHLHIASHADIGLLVYVSENSVFGLNAMYCAPNKIYEYTGFGMPVLTNNIPGLYYTVEMNKIGRCIEFNDKKQIKESLENILDNYDKYSENAIKFYKSINTKDSIDNILGKFDEKQNKRIKDSKI